MLLAWSCYPHPSWGRAAWAGSPAVGIRAAAEGRAVRRGSVLEGRRLLLRWDDGGRDLRLPARARVPPPLASSLQLPSPPLQ